MKARSGLASYHDATKVPTIPSPFSLPGNLFLFYQQIQAKDPSTSGPLHELPLPLEHFTLPVRLGVAICLIISALGGGHEDEGKASLGNISSLRHTWVT